mmetsp:Transcript_20772/g.40776  ORF Transcript_20772/g.40776 Transcript_20772/m.40776 type:complete len:811 (-) Transcript_20772:61-2493(-)
MLDLKTACADPARCWREVTRVSDWTFATQLLVRRAVMVSVTLVLSYMEPIVKVLGSTTIFLPILSLLMCMVGDLSTNVGVITQLALAFCISLIAIGVGFAAALAIQDSLPGLLVWTFFNSFCCFYFFCNEQAPQRKMPGAIALIMIDTITLTGYVLALDYGYVPFDLIEKYAGEFTLAFVLSTATFTISALTIFPWLAYKKYFQGERELRHETAAMLRQTCAITRGAPASTFPELQFVDLRKKGVQLGSLASSSAYELRWKFDGSGARLKETYQISWRIVRLTIMLNEASRTMLGSPRMERAWDAITQWVEAICQVLETEELEMYKTYVELCRDRRDEAKRILQECSQAEIREDEFLGLTWLTLSRIGRLLQNLQDVHYRTKEQKPFKFNLVDWKSTIIFGAGTNKKSFFNAARSYTWFERMTNAFSNFTSTQTFKAALKGAMAVTVFVACIFGTNLHFTVGVNAAVNGLHALESVLRQMYLGPCIKRTWDRAFGSFLGFVAAGAAWTIACAGSGWVSNPALGGWTLFLLGIPVYIPFYLKPNYFRYSIGKVYVIVALIGIYELAGPGEKFPGFWEAGGIMTAAIIFGCVVGAIFCPVVSTNSAKSSLELLMIFSLQELVHVVQCGYIRASDPSVVSEDVLEASLWQLWNESRARGTKLLQSAATESRFGDSIEWYKEALSLVTKMETSVWRINTLVDWTTIPEETRRAISEELCTNFFFVSAILEKNVMHSVFQPPRLSLDLSTINTSALKEPDEIMSVLCSRTVLRTSHQTLSDAFNEFYKITKQRLGGPAYASNFLHPSISTSISPS